MEALCQLSYSPVRDAREYLAQVGDPNVIDRRFLTDRGRQRTSLLRAVGEPAGSGAAARP